jgi:AraC-like DNA-binding protein
MKTRASGLTLPHIETQIALGNEVFLMSIATGGEELNTSDIPKGERYAFAALVYQMPGAHSNYPNISVVKTSEESKGNIPNSGRIFIIYCKSNWLQSQAKIHLEDPEACCPTTDHFHSFLHLRIQNLELIEEIKRLEVLESVHEVSEIEWAYFTFLVSRSFFRKQWSLIQNKPAKSYRAEMIRNAIKYMEMHLEGHPLSVQDIATHCNVSPSKLKTIFKTETNDSVYRYYLNLRLDHAADLLATTSLNVSEVAYKIGYSHIGKFSKMFKERHGTLPSRHVRDAQVAG